MVWKEFKAFVDKELEKQGKSGNEIIFFIDTGNYPEADCLVVMVGTNDEMVITSEI